jgi:hypothetical protein
MANCNHLASVCAMRVASCWPGHERDILASSCFMVTCCVLVVKHGASQLTVAVSQDKVFLTLLNALLLQHSWCRAQTGGSSSWCLQCQAGAQRTRTSAATLHLCLTLGKAAACSIAHEAAHGCSLSRILCMHTGKPCGILCLRGVLISNTSGSNTQFHRKLLHMQPCLGVAWLAGQGCACC